VMDDGRKCLQGAVCVRNVPERHERLVIIDGDPCSGVWQKREIADREANMGRVVCVLVEWQDGEGLT
jgi:hypothetical protein